MPGSLKYRFTAKTVKVDASSPESLDMVSAELSLDNNRLGPPLSTEEVSHIHEGTVLSKQNDRELALVEESFAAAAPYLRD